MKPPQIQRTQRMPPLTNPGGGRVGFCLYFIFIIKNTAQHVQFIYVFLAGGNTADDVSDVTYAAVEIKQKGIINMMTYLTWLSRIVVQL